MVDIEIRDEDISDIGVFVLRIPGGNGSVVEEAEAHRVIGSCVVTGRPTGDEGRLRFSGDNGIHGPTGATRSETRDLG